MTHRKIPWSVFGAAVALFVVVLGWRAYGVFDTSRSAVADDRLQLAVTHVTDQASIRRGEYVMRMGDCAACHNAGQGRLAGGYKFPTAFGLLLSSNITPDPDTGIGKMTERDFFNALRHGRGSHGLLYPAMPYTAYVKMNDRDLHDLWAYFSTVPRVRNVVSENGAMNFPFNIRLAMAGWDLLFFDNTAMKPAIGLSAQQQRGQYLVDAAHCSACHSPRNLLGAEKASAYLQGGSLGSWYAPDITPNPHAANAGMSQQELVSYLTTGAGGGAVAAGSMGEAVEHSLQYATAADANAIAAYLRVVKPSGTKPSPPATLDAATREHGALDYEVNCSACHGLKGEGIPGMIPAFAGNRGMLIDDPTNLIHAMLKGVRAPHTQARPTAAGMPSFAWKMDDAQIAAMLDYVRNSWGNTAGAVTAKQVKDLRASLKARVKLQTPDH